MSLTCSLMRSTDGTRSGPINVGLPMTYDSLEKQMESGAANQLEIIGTYVLQVLFECPPTICLLRTQAAPPPRNWRQLATTVFAVDETIPISLEISEARCICNADFWFISSEGHIKTHDDRFPVCKDLISLDVRLDEADCYRLMLWRDSFPWTRTAMSQEFRKWEDNIFPNESAVFALYREKTMGY